MRKTTQAICAILFLLTAALITQPGMAQDRSPGEPGRSSAGPNPLKNVYFGEQHLHTSNSPDAFMVGTRGTWEDATPSEGRRGR